MTLTIYTDGGSLNNPGEAAIAYAIYQDGKLIDSFSKRIGKASNNIAEYTALLEALTKAKEFTDKLPITAIQVFSDSLLMVSQVNGTFRVKNAPIGELLMKLRLIEAELNTPVTYTHVLRDKNQFTDDLVKKMLGK